MSSDSSDSDGDGRRKTKFGPDSERRRQEDDSKGPRTPSSGDDVKGPRTPGSGDESKGPRTPGSGDESKGPRTPGSGPRSPSNSPARSISSHGSQRRGPQSPPENLDDDGRSNISSGSSILSNSPKRVEGPADSVKSPPTKSHFTVPDAEDLSDVSDINDSDGLAEDPKSPKPEEKRKSPDTRKETHDRNFRGKRDSIHMDDGEQLDFEADDQPDVDKEDGEVPEPAAPVGAKKKESKDVEDGEEKSGDDGEVKDDGNESLEEGEVSDEGDPKPEKPPICRFYSRGACTWGANCRFLHPGVTDKGNYSMFEVTRPMVAPPNGLGHYPPEPRGYAHARPIGSPYGPLVRREDPAAVESAWERGFRQAKELVRKSSKRKETDMDFEEKKMNLSIGQDEMDKENDYYSRVASPIDDPELWAARASPKYEERRPAVRVVERYEDIIPESMSPSVYDREYRRGYEKVRDPEYKLRREMKYYPEDEHVARKAGKKMVREVIVHRMERGERSKRVPSEEGRRPDEWSDPWMRSKSPGGRKGHRSRKVSYSSRSSSFSGSSSRSSSNSSYSSYSRSRSGSRSGSASPTPKRARKSRLARAKLLEGKTKSTKAVGEKTAAVRPMLMNPPPPEPRRVKELSPSAAIRKVGLNPPAPTTKPRGVPKHGGKVRNRKSRSSSSGSSSSGSESSHSSGSSSSSSRGAPQARGTKKPEPEEKLPPVVPKVKVPEPKPPVQKPQIKLSIKPLEKKSGLPAPVPGKKRPAEEPPAADPKEPSPPKTAAGKKPSSRREELLKQLKAVEDAIARKRSKI